jgi:hypothetical protein
MTLNEFKELLKKVINTPELLAEMGLALESIDGGPVVVTDLTASGTTTLAATSMESATVSGNVAVTGQIGAGTVTASNVVVTTAVTVFGDITVVDDIVCDGLTIESLAFAGGTGTWSGDFNGSTGVFRAKDVYINEILSHEGSFVGFYNATPTGKPTVTGSRGGNAALTSLLTSLATQGLITNSTSA